ncbi:MAG: ATP-dependent helicase [Ignavibacteria bacterium]|jgi:superfamily I DNA/RNA helicase|nr:ATP-dependent helicase [Ignavibacteria bacterium]MCU7501886.1 ATP-dependent helicase [Ignavibacteria bacterium]MCU7514768.1 ATP-dependent helicase [Ignavibacteria bacterium]
MQLTQEQKNIINSHGDLKINAVAGSGKTTTLIEYARKRAKKNEKLLYLAFNSSVKKYAREKFLSEGMKNVRVETAHSLAFDSVVKRSNYTIGNGLGTSQVRDALSLNSNSRDRNAVYILANHIKKFVSYYCNSTKEKVQELDYSSVVSDPVARAFVKTYYEQIEYGTRLLLTKMLKAEVDITHDFYLKMFQLKEPYLKYDYILFDEGQDASPAMLDVFLNQKSTRVIVGDTHQQIYGWRYAINSLENVEGFEEMSLGTSFRLDSEMARLAMSVLKWKENFTSYRENLITGLGHRKELKTRAVIARTNLRLLVKAISLVTGFSGINKIYFEGNLNSYIFAGEGASLYDVLNLSTGNLHLIRDELIGRMKGIDELKEYAEQSEETELLMLIDIVEEYGKELPRLIKLLKERHLPDSERHKADMIFSTVHRCKGMEYDEVTLEKDFISEEAIKKAIRKEGIKNIDAAGLSEEINLLYVAITRTKSRLKIPEELLSPDLREDLLSSEKHFLIPAREAPGRYSPGINKSILFKKPASSNIRWTPEMDAELEKRVCKNVPMKFIAEYFGATRKAVRKRLGELDLYGKYDLDAERY